MMIVQFSMYSGVVCIGMVVIIGSFDTIVNYVIIWWLGVEEQVWFSGGFMVLQFINLMVVYYYSINLMVVVQVWFSGGYCGVVYFHQEKYNKMYNGMGVVEVSEWEWVRV